MTEEDFCLLAVLSIWDNTANMAYFFLLIMSMRHLAGRGNEVSRASFPNLTVAIPPEFNLGGAPPSSTVASSKMIFKAPK
jgi:hypothetical protein